MYCGNITSSEENNSNNTELKNTFDISVDVAIQYHATIHHSADMFHSLLRSLPLKIKNIYSKLTF